MDRIILASSSKYRKQLIDKLGINVSCSSPDIDERPAAGESAPALTQRLSIAKAMAVAEKYNQHLIIGSDQVADLNGKIITKPGDHAAAAAQLMACSGQTVVFHTGLCLCNSASGRHNYLAANTEVKFRQLQARQVERYLRLEQPYDCAGSFKAEGLGICLFEYIRGDDPSALIGLPLIHLTSLLLGEGIELPYSPPRL